MNYIFLNSQSSEFSIYDLHLTRCIARVCCKSLADGFPPSNSTQTTDGCGVSHGHRDI